MWAFFKRRKCNAGIDIGTTAIKTVALSFESSGPRIQEILCLQDPGLSSIEKRIQAIPLMARHLPDRVAVAIPPDRVDIQYFPLPPLPPDDMIGTVSYQMVRKLDYGVEDACIDYTVSVPMSQGLNRIVGFACRRPDAETLVEQFRRADFHVAAIDVIPMALMNIYRLSIPEFPLQTVVGIDIGHKTVNMVIAKEGLLLFSRHFPLEHHPGDLDESSMGVSVSELEYELRRTVDYCQIHITSVHVDRVVLSGGGALQPGLTDDLGRASGVPCEILDCFPERIFRHTTDSRKALEQIPSPRMAVAAGLALRFGENG